LSDYHDRSEIVLDSYGPTDANSQPKVVGLVSHSEDWRRSSKWLCHDISTQHS